MKHKVCIETWERRDNYRFFEKFLNPCISFTAEVRCTGARKLTRENGESFFLHYLYAILRAVNEIRELRFRFDADGEVVWFDTVDVMVPVRINDSGKFYTVRIPWHPDFATFYAEAFRIVHTLPADGDPYAATHAASGDDRYNVVLVSAIPDLFFTSITYTQQHAHGNDYPLMNVGKAVERGGEWIMPVALSVDHSFVDGAHIADFYKRVETYLN